ncbi:hypothetical protein CJ030_MR4G029061 [Morella rubra]|uniref:Uncharacterized protein n=1 Tax=Morella rubra TaxID=262757 RepID=A0A6A1VUS1_9ROSI|nr:hypothetical protein CJ030_MR4G029061 [Morella rubra]
MNGAMKAALISSKASCFHLRAALFHSTPVLERKRRNYWETSWREEDDEDNPSSSKGPSWFKKEFSAKGSKRDWTGNRGPKQQGRSKDISSALMLKEKLHLLLQNYT